MSVSSPFKEAHENMPGDGNVSLLTQDGRQEYLNQLEQVFKGHELPEDATASEHLTQAVFDRDLHLEERRSLANTAFDQAKDSLIEKVPTRLGGKKAREAAKEAEALSASFVEGLILFAEGQAEGSDDTLEKFKAKMAFLYPEEKTPESSMVIGIIMLNVLQPYVVDRMLELDVYDPAKMKEQVGEIVYDCRQIASFYRSVSDFMRLTVTGESDLDDNEIADKLFGIGPLFAQIGQSFSRVIDETDEGGMQSVKNTASAVGRAFQEGIAMPDRQQQETLSANLPDGLSLVNVFSSAKIAYVARTRFGDEEFATKIRRPEVEAALAGNIRTFTIITDVMRRYIETHAGDTALAERQGLVRDTLPYLLFVLERDMLEEMDFTHEASLQKRGRAVLEAHEGITVPDVHDEHSDNTHITMPLIPSERIEDVEANPNYLKNMMVLLLEGRRQRFIHGDMHAGNIKAHADSSGDIVAFDWGKSVELAPGFEKNVVRLLTGAFTRKPKSIAKAYMSVQDPSSTQVSEDEARLAAEQAVAAVADGQSGNEDDSSPVGRLQETSDVLVTFLTIMAKDYQSGLDVRYVNYMKSMSSLASIVKAELAKPEYASRSFKTKAILNSAVSALREVYRRK